MSVDTRRQATLAGIPLKHLSLVTLTFQNSALILIMHYSRIMPLVNGQRYQTSTAVLLNEVIKLGISLTMALYDIASSPQTPDGSTAGSLFSQLWKSVFTPDSWKLAIPALLYTLQNSLQYVAVSNLDAATFQVTYQLKILTTALFSVTMLGRSLSVRRWASLVLLMFGVAVVQIPLDTPKAAVSSRSVGMLSSRSLAESGFDAAGQLFKRSGTYQGIHGDITGSQAVLNPSVGFFAVIVACLISGLAGVYFEKILKDPKGESNQVSVWIRNVQLSFFSIWPALLLGVMLKDGKVIAETGFFAGYNWVVWTAVIFQALGGIVVALVVNYADNIAKNFATSISIIVSFLASVYFFNFRITFQYVAGTAIVLLATYIYNTSPSEQKASPLPTKESSSEESRSVS